MTDPQTGGGGAGTFFDTRQRATIEAAMARIIPTDDRPGAREAGTIEFLDRYLSGLDFIYAKPDGSGFEKLEGKRAEAWKQRIEILRAKYVAAIKERDRRGRFQLGEGDELSVIAAAVLGGTSLFGGFGSVVGSIVGALMIGLINNGLILMGLEFSQQLIARSYHNPGSDGRQVT
jgi:hypothetical protein